MRILWLATKAPWPPIDGGRFLLFDTLRGLSDRGHAVTLVAPVDPDAFDLEEVAERLRPLCRPVLLPARPRSMVSSVLRSVFRRLPLTAARHGRDDVGRAVERELADGPFDLIQLEQIQALGSLPEDVGGLPVVLRAQNVESDLWLGTAAHSGGWKRRLLHGEARRLARFEGEVMRRVDATVALTREDASRLTEMAGSEADVRVVRAPFAPILPSAEHDLPGSPPLVLFGSGGWLPNRDGARWFQEQIWPRIRHALPGARLHLFGGDEPVTVGEDSIVVHPAPESSREALPANGILVVPLHIASGVRIKILEAWARGVPVVATSTAARGLEAESGRELYTAEDADGFLSALRHLEDSAQRVRIIEAGRARLKTGHALERIVADLEAVYEDVCARAKSG